MPAVVDTANSPIRFTGTTAGIASAAFTAPANALLVACHEYDGNTTETSSAMSDSGGLTWTKRVERSVAEATAGGGSAIWTARTTSAVSRTVTATMSVAGWRHSARVYVVTGPDVDGTPVDTVGANNEGSSSTDSFNTSSLTPGATGLLFAACADYGAAGVFDASSDLTQDTAHYASVLSVCDGYKAVTSGVAATANLNGGGAAASQHKWCQIIVREASSGTGTSTSQVFTANGTFTWPTDVTSVTAEAIGGGGGGGLASGNPASGGGGKGAGYSRAVITKGAETTLAVVVGAGGAAGAAGTVSTVTQVSTVRVSALAGSAGTAGSANSTNGAGATGNVGSTVGSTSFAGGNGSTGAFATRSGSGGGAAGPGSIGGSASGTTSAGTAGTGTFGNGLVYQAAGAFGVVPGTVGVLGPSYGGGGSGGNANAAADRAGGAGGPGIVVISWTLPPPPQALVPRRFRRQAIQPLLRR